MNRVQTDQVYFFYDHKKRSIRCQMTEVKISCVSSCAVQKRTDPVRKSPENSSEKGQTMTCSNKSEAHFIAVKDN